MYSPFFQMAGPSRPARSAQRAAFGAARACGVRAAGKSAVNRDATRRRLDAGRGHGKRGSSRVGPKQPIRSCVGCGATVEAEELLRIVLFTEELPVGGAADVRAPEDDGSTERLAQGREAEPGLGQVVLDLSGKLPGRGAWIHARQACFERACPRGLSRSFRCAVTTTADELLAQLGEATARRLNGLILAGSRARHLICGRDAVKEALPTSALVVMATDAKSVAKDAVLQRAGLSGKIVCWSTKAELGHLLGRAEVGVFAITERSLADAMRRTLALQSLSIRQDSVKPDASLTVASTKELSEVR